MVAISDLQPRWCSVIVKNTVRSLITLRALLSFTLL